mmetsp:Transcript_18080/g.44977  ORF Transcript_18080/g.44977 Transcript_18080/m.44977 type:complete len:192 (+) Transcript_18080:103-678(+)|eukprot:CAMPEP_0116102194 /NCGR_PEP_ID=MMETSP0327-20121206/13216_1 /TAXON_ID=44447 /ORGANISM="Pseudo-nitzschia delicatissima, Strain B596" /LENGTH=191 /DNA_ID=CAMNT_0003594211 /DNA_START=83 /DNA_END=658 /DNA_ORIENTATION=-
MAISVARTIPYPSSSFRTSKLSFRLFFTVDIPQFCFFWTSTVQDIGVSIGFQEFLGLLSSASPATVCDNGSVLRNRIGWEGHGVGIAIPDEVQSAGPDVRRRDGGNSEGLLVTGFLLGIGIAHVDNDQVVPCGLDQFGQFIERCYAWFWCHLDAGSASKGSACDRLAASIGDGSEGTDESTGKHDSARRKD